MSRAIADGGKIDNSIKKRKQSDENIIIINTLTKVEDQKCRNDNQMPEQVLHIHI